MLATGDVGLHLPDDVQRDLLARPLMCGSTRVPPEDLAGGPQISATPDGEDRQPGQRGRGARERSQDIREMDRIELTNVPLCCVIKLQG